MLDLQTIIYIVIALLVAYFVYTRFIKPTPPQPEDKKK